MPYETIMYCTKSEKGYLDHFNLHPKTTFIYTEKFPILNVRVSETKDADDFYWAWWDTKKQKFSFVHKYKGGITICFPCPLSEYEKQGEGKLMKVKVEIIKEINSL